jgi:hypothetical protein
MEGKRAIAGILASLAVGGKVIEQGRGGHEEDKPEPMPPS